MPHEEGKAFLKKRPVKLVLLRISLLSSLDSLETKATPLCERQKSGFIQDSAGRYLSAAVWNQHPKRDFPEGAGGGATLPFLGVRGIGGVKLLSGLQRSLFGEAG